MPLFGDLLVPPTPDAWFRNAVEQLDLGVTISDIEGRILYTNRAEASMHGYSVDELLGRNVRVFAAEAPPVPRVSREVLRTRDQPFEREGQNARRDGSRFPVRLLSDVLRDPYGEPQAMVTICEDITFQREAEARLRQAQKMELLGQLTGGIAHDFNNVLTVILANLDLMTTYDADQYGEIENLVDETRRVARQGAALARQLLGFSRRDSLHFERVSVSHLLDEYARVIRRVLPETIELRITRDRHLPTVAADPHAVQQVLLNLVTNARDAMPGGGQLTVLGSRAEITDEFIVQHGWGRLGDYVAVQVKDTGSGMDEATRRRIFEPFFTTKPEGAGTGLGMAMVYSLMKQHRGFVHAVSAPNHGTAITLWFPVERVSESPQAPSAPRRPSRAPAGTETVLVVEDEAPLRRTAARSLQKFGYTVMVAGDGKEGLGTWREHRDAIDLIVTDIQMPRMGGRELAERLREEGCLVPIVFASGYGAEGEPEGTSGVDHTRHLPKPWTLTELLDTVRDALDGVDPPGASAA